MIKKIVLAVTFALSLTGAFAALSVQQGEPAAINEDNQVVAEAPEGQVYVETDAVPSEEVDAVEESETTRKMLQAEKVENVKENDKYGLAITIMAMVIVLMALIILCLLFNVFGKIAAATMSKKKANATGVDHSEIDDHHDHLDSGEVIAAIAMALDEHFNSKHDLEDTVLTIKRMKRAYSPWNSKIYSMREVPQLRKR